MSKARSPRSSRRIFPPWFRTACLILALVCVLTFCACALRYREPDIRLLHAALGAAAIGGGSTVWELLKRFARMTDEPACDDDADDDPPKLPIR